MTNHKITKMLIKMKTEHKIKIEFKIKTIVYQWDQNNTGSQ